MFLGGGTKLLKTIKLEDFGEYEEYFNGKLPSKSFTKKLCSSVSVQLKALIKDIRHKENFTEMITLRYGSFPQKYDIFNPSKIHICIEAKNMALELAEGYVLWRTQKAELANTVYPWSDVSDVDLFFRLRLEPCEVRKLNWALADLPLPTYKSKDTGLPYDFQIKNLVLDGTLVITCKDETTSEHILCLEKTLWEFFDNYNKNHEEKIHYISDFKRRKDKVCVDIDAITTPIEAIEECIKGFSKFDFIKKIVFK